jgi:hypothetical protein
MILRLTPKTAALVGVTPLPPLILHSSHSTPDQIATLHLSAACPAPTLGESRIEWAIFPDAK